MCDINNERENEDRHTAVLVSSAYEAYSFSFCCEKGVKLKKHYLLIEERASTASEHFMEVAASSIIMG
ncbi:uncharacterized protein PHALS_08826 [Plasmopara halstedii]|uniref:Uncharacterized protein n=1 Tax=Plasmopara halstedii TaxID=4781 RepID=A0A0P1ADU0_PLAHL|nr:uncharacterized protein PHALS_08826 [Plasmopara halstedii]CEG38772.1 hypothetical protein PHALS_08826 [Plasmopara halstedii]|eukprot:XP_024575141.1 hypothetical protein PHALS_08826 [Plasmopara halstedii]